MMAKGAFKRIALICAVNQECDRIVQSLKWLSTEKRGPTVIYKGRYSGRIINVFVSGPGKTNASSATTMAALLYRPELIINLGIAGAYPGCGLDVGGLALCTEDIYAEEGVLTKRGFKGLKEISLCLLPEQGIYNRIPFDRPLTMRAKGLLTSMGHDVRMGRFLTVSTVTGSTDRAEELKRRFKPLCETMEGAAVGHIALAFSLPALQIRGISNRVENRNRRKWKIKEAALHCQSAVLELLKVL
ncbi:MAG: futalosine hydrolase [Nitrospirae bacterium]|nr:MAG: futalosine hydrolase [Nitrospirota bacterium]